MGDQGIGGQVKIEIPGSISANLSRREAFDLLNRVERIEWEDGKDGFTENERLRVAILFKTKFPIISKDKYLPTRVLTRFISVLQKASRKLPHDQEYKCGFERVDDKEFDGVILESKCRETLTYSALLFIKEDKLRVREFRIGINCTRSFAKPHESSSKNESMVTQRLISVTE